MTQKMIDRFGGLTLALLTFALAYSTPAAAQEKPTDDKGAKATQAPAPQEAAPEAPREYTAALATGNKAYNDSQYEKAIEAYTQAIQVYPEGKEAYRNMARSCFWLNDYAQAIAYYDVYLVNYPKAEDLAQIQQERRLASARSPAPYTSPATQRRALEELELALGSGVGYAKGGGGAWRSYEQLLRTGYAWPDLIKLRQRLSLKLLLEHDDQLQTRASQPLPTLDMEAWQLQRERLQAALSVAPFDVAESISKRLLISDAAQSLLLSKYEEAATKATAAIEANPDQRFLHWFLLTALLQSNKNDEALSALERLEPRLKREEPSQLDYARVVRAMIYQKQGKAQEAASLYRASLEP